MNTTRQTYSRYEVEILVSAKTAVKLIDANGNPRHKRHDTLKGIEVEAIHILSRYAMNSIMGPSSPMWGTTE